MYEQKMLDLQAMFIAQAVEQKIAHADTVLAGLTIGLTELTNANGTTEADLALFALIYTESV